MITHKAKIARCGAAPKANFFIFGGGGGGVVVSVYKALDSVIHCVASRECATKPSWNKTFPETI